MHRMLQVLDVIEAVLAAVADASSAFLTVAEKAEGGPPVGGGRGPRRGAEAGCDGCDGRG